MEISRLPKHVFDLAYVVWTGVEGLRDGPLHGTLAANVRSAVDKLDETTSDRPPQWLSGCIKFQRETSQGEHQLH